jgi:hypothetical protein
MSPPQVDAGTVEMRQRGQFVTVIPEMPKLANHLFTVRHARAHDAEIGTGILPIREDLVYRSTRHERPVTECPAGLKLLVMAILQRDGQRVRTTGTALAKLPEPDLGQFGDPECVDVSTLNFIHQHERGLIRVHRSKQLSLTKLLAQIALAWPKQQIIIVATRVDHAKRLQRQLDKYVKAGLSAGNRSTPRSRRVIVATPGKLGRGDIGIERRHIYIAMNPDELVATTEGLGVDGLKRLWKARLFGIVHVDEQFPPRTRDLLTAYFGTEQVVVPAHGRRLIDVDVVFSPIVGGYRPPHHRDEALLKRLGINEHDLRNRRIVNLARALAGNDGELLRDKFVEVADRLEGQTGRVGVLVDQVGHGLVLARKLNWPLVTRLNSVKRGLSADERALIRRGNVVRERTRGPVVVTTDGLKRAGKFTVLIRADGGVGMPELPMPLLTAPHNKPAKLLMVDFRDEQHPLLRQWSRQRRTAYMHAGWNVVGEPVLSALDKFMAERPEVVR